MIQTSRRSFLSGAVATLFAPAIVKFENLMPTKLFMLEPVIIRSNSLLTLEMIAREAVELWANSNIFMRSLRNDYEGHYEY